MSFMTNCVKNEIKELLTQLDAKLRHDYIGRPINPSFANGHAGIAMFYAYYYRLTQDKCHLEICKNAIDQLIEYLANNENDFTYSICNGIAGIGWTIQHIVNENILEASPSIFSDIDEILSTIGTNHIAHGNYDYLHAGLGCGIYFLERKNNPSVLENMLTALDQSSYTSNTGKYWLDIFTTRWNGDKRPMVSFGLSHGQPSIIFFLSKLVEMRLGGSLAIDMLRDSINYLIVNANTAEYVNSFFPVCHYEGAIEPKIMSRLAWCYGDLGVLFSLWHSSVALKDKELQKTVLQMAIRTTNRKSPEETHINDGGLCHGYAGAAHLYNRLYMFTDNSIFLDASNYWTNKLIGYINNSGGIQYFSEYDKTPDFDGFKLATGFLGGSAGAGLALISILEPSIKPNWDRFLLLS